MARLGTKANPLILNVHDEERAMRLYALCELRGWHVIMGLNKHEPEDFDDLIQKLEPDIIEYDEPKIGRNELCPCGSGKKYKKCCLEHSYAELG